MSTIAALTGNIDMFSHLLAAQAASIHTSQQRIASGLRLNSAADDPAGMVQAVSLRVQVSSLGVAARNGQSAVNVAQIAQGGYATAQSILGRMSDLVVSAGDPVADKTALAAEFTALRDQLDTLAQGTEVNGIKLLDGSQAGTGLNFMVGTGSAAGDYLNVKLASVKAADLGVAGIDLATADATALSTAAAAIATATGKVTGSASAAGTLERVTTMRIDAMSSQRDILSDAYDRIAGADVAAETMNISRQQILSESTAAMFAQARVSATSTLRLLLG